MGSIVDGYCVVTIVGHQVRDPDIRGANIEAICVEREALPLVRNRVDNRVRDVDIAALDLDIPRNGLARLEASDTSALGIEHHQVWASGDSGSIRGVGIPPLLSVGIDPAVVRVFASGVVDVRATDVKPENCL